jgi:hypothetical protein
MVGGDVIFEAEAVDQRFLSDRSLAHHGQCPHTAKRTESDHQRNFKSAFFNTIGAKQPYAVSPPGRTADGTGGRPGATTDPRTASIWEISRGGVVSHKPDLRGGVVSHKASPTRTA